MKKGVDRAVRGEKPNPSSLLSSREKMREREKVGEEGQREDNGEGGAAPGEEYNGERSSGGASGPCQPTISSASIPLHAFRRIRLQLFSSFPFAFLIGSTCSL